MHDLTEAAFAFLAERHLATLTTLRADGSPHVVPVGFTIDPADGLARVITDGGSRKAAHLRADPRGAICQVDAGRWLTVEGSCRVSGDPAEVRHAEQLYAGRYRVPRVNPTRVVVLMTVERVLSSATLR